MVDPDDVGECMHCGRHYLCNEYAPYCTAQCRDKKTVTYHYRGMKQRGEYDGSPILADVYSETKDSKQMTFDECKKDARRRKLRAVFSRQRDSE